MVIYCTDSIAKDVAPFLLNDIIKKKRSYVTIQRPISLISTYLLTRLTSYVRIELSNPLKKSKITLETDKKCRIPGN